MIASIGKAMSEGFEVRADHGLAANAYIRFIQQDCTKLSRSARSASRKGGSEVI